MSSALRQPGMLVCWNCDDAVDEAIRIRIQPQGGGTVTVPLCRSCYVSVYQPLATDAPELHLAPSRSVLIVDDDPGIRGLLTMLFEGEGFRVDTATNGREALRKACADRPGAIVLDLRMPVMSGREFLEKWRQTTAYPAVPVLAMSAYDVCSTAEELGVQAFLPKPLSMSTLLSTVDRLVGQLNRTAPFSEA